MKEVDSMYVPSAIAAGMVVAAGAVQYTTGTEAPDYLFSTVLLLLLFSIGVYAGRGGL